MPRNGTGPEARATFEWILDGRFLVQRTHVPVPEAPDSMIISPLDFCQRFTGTFSDDRTTIDGVWEKSPDGTTWSHDFALKYRRIG